MATTSRTDRTLGASPFVFAATRKVPGLRLADANAMLKRERSAGYDPRNSYDAVHARDHVWSAAVKRRDKAGEEKQRMLDVLLTTTLLRVGV